VEPDDVERFMADGFIKLEGAVPLPVIEECRVILWQELGLNPDDPTTWAEPVRWVLGLDQPAFKWAMNVLPLLEACEALAGPGRWTPRGSMGAFPLRFPHDEEPEGLGWHVEGSFMPEGATSYWTNLASKDRAMLALYLFTDIEEEDGPTRIRVGSHHDVPSVLLPFGEEGAAGNQLGPLVDAASAHRTEVHATGQAGDIYLCHPFLVHAAQANHGTRPRFIGQPAILPLNPYRYDLPDQESSPVELTIKRALNQARWPVP
jgi:hypothetical protein